MKQIEGHFFIFIIAAVGFRCGYFILKPVEFYSTVF